MNPKLKEMFSVSKKDFSDVYDSVHSEWFIRVYHIYEHMHTEMVKCSRTRVGAC